MSLISTINQFNESLMESASEHKGALVAAAIGGVALAGTLFCPIGFVALPCALVTASVTLGLIWEGRSYNERQDWLEAALDGRSISDRHGNIVEDEHYMLDCPDPNKPGSVYIDPRDYEDLPFPSSYDVEKMVDLPWYVQGQGYGGYGLWLGVTKDVQDWMVENDLVAIWTEHPGTMKPCGIFRTVEEATTFRDHIQELRAGMMKAGLIDASDVALPIVIDDREDDGNPMDDQFPLPPRHKK